MSITLLTCLVVSIDRTLHRADACGGAITAFFFTPWRAPRY